MKKLILMGALLGCLPLQAQAPQSYEEFRKSILDNYDEFRKTILSHYADFLNGTWHEYEPMMPVEKDKTPKPKRVPKVSDIKPETKPVDLPKPKKATPTPEQPAPVAENPKPAPEDKKPSIPASPFETPKPEIPPEAKDPVPPSLKVKPDLGKPILADIPDLQRLIVPDVPEEEQPEVPEVPVTPVVPEESREGKDPVKFYGMEILVPSVDFKVMEQMGTVADFARNWKTMDEQKLADNLLAALKPKMKELGLNDYLTYEFLCAYMDSKFPQLGAAPKMSAVHYLLTNLGFNARIALLTKTGDPIILMPAKQNLYGKVFMNMGGQKYYVMSAPGVNIMGQTIATCDLPKVADGGKSFDFLISGLNLPVKERPFDISYGKLNLKGTVNENLMPVVYRYPQMETADFAESCLDKGVREELVAQVKEQLAGMDKVAATNELLQFVQSGFAYATDDAFHGFEKPYFLEENLFYPKNDCEDRAILYTYLLWNALGVENQLLFYPGHESASVALPGEIYGTSYEYGGKKYYISDPTYIGSITGQCMPQFTTTSPKIDLSLPNE